MIKSHWPRKATVSGMWEAAALGLFRQRCVPLSLTRSWWEILTMCVRARVCGGGRKKRERMLERESVCQIADVAVCECVKARREFMRWHLVSCLTFPVSQGSSFKNNAEEKPPTTDNWNATRKRRRRKKKIPELFVGDWIIAIAWDWRQGKCVSDCTLLVADTYHQPDSSTHPSPSAAHNGRNTLKKSESGGKGTQDKYCVSIFPPSPLQLSLTLTDEQWKYFELCCALSFYFWVQNRAVKARRALAEIDWFAFCAPCLPFVLPGRLWFLSSLPDSL